MSKKLLSALDMARQAEGESTRSFMCGGCTGSKYELLSVDSEEYSKGFRFRCTDCGLLMKDLKSNNIYFSE